MTGNGSPSESRFIAITGAAGGIGRETALALARSGWHLVLTDLDAAALNEVSSASVEDDAGI
jgi:NAD(P)-dependent dehydrogenase (short-subunit alcohol dehydrogenase family)